MIRIPGIKSSNSEPLSELDFQRIKCSIHEELVESLDLAAVGCVDDAWMRDEVRDLSQQIISGRGLKLTSTDKDRMLAELDAEVFGLGPLDSLMEDSSVSDILVNKADEVFAERYGRLEKTPIIFADDAHVMRIIQRIVGRIGRRIDEVSPMVDARLADGSRVNAVVSPLALDGPKLSIRRFGAEYLKIDNLIANGTLSHEMAEFLRAAVAARISFLISGGTGAGKTTMLNALSHSIPHDERIVTIEDSAELLLQHPHVARMETRPVNIEGQGQVSQRDLVKNSLRMRPDRILVGEVRGAEALDMLQAMNTGHEGSLTTIHANDSADALARLEMMVAMTGYELPISVVREYIASGIKLVVHLARLKGGVRKITQISEIVGVADGKYRLEDVFGFRQNGLDREGVAQGSFYCSGYTPKCIGRFADAGVELNPGLFSPATIG